MSERFSDLEATRLCALTMGLKVVCEAGTDAWYLETASYPGMQGYDVYIPLTNDAQAYALEDWLIERGYLHYEDGNSMFYTWPLESSANTFSQWFKDRTGRRRAIVHAVAAMQAGR